MSTPHLPTPDNDAAPPSGARPRLTTEHLYAEHWEFVLNLLHRYGFAGADLDDAAQTVWEQVHEQIETYDPHSGSPRAWLTGFVKNVRSTFHRRGVVRKVEELTEEPGALSAAHGMSPEHAAILAQLSKAIPNKKRLEAFVLRWMHEMTIEEIAAYQRVSESTVKWRLAVANEEVRGGESKERAEKAGAYLGFGSLEALAKAMRPPPRPLSQGAALWKRIERSIQEKDRHGSHGRDGSGDWKPSQVPAAPPAPTVPPLAPSAPLRPAAITLAKSKLAGLLVAVFAAGAASGVGGTLGWMRASRLGHEARADDVARPVPPLEMEPAATLPLPSSPSPASSSTAPSSTAAGAREPDASASKRLLWRMRHAAKVQDFETVIALAEQHAQQHPAAAVGEREELRIGALMGLGRAEEAEQHARSIIAASPSLRAAVERGLGYALP